LRGKGEIERERERERKKKGLICRLFSKRGGERERERILLNFLAVAFHIR
jgi:hypothetical protein